VLRPGLGMAPPLRLSVSASPKGQAWETGLALDGSAPFGPALRWENSLALRDAWSAHATLGATPIPGNSDPTSEDEKLLEIDTLSADLGATWRW